MQRTVVTLALVLSALVLSALTGPRAAAQSIRFADIPADSPYAERGRTELRTIDRAMDDLGLEPDHDPWGRRVCALYFRSYEIFFDEDVPPVWLNVFHRTTRERVVRRANTVEVGDRFEPPTYEDAERAIRDPLVFSVAAVVPVETGAEGCVDVLVVTRDIWSLKASWSIETNGSTVTSLYLAATENNLFGTAESLSMSFTRTLGSWQIGPTYSSRHIAGSRLTVYESFRFVVDREVGGLEGTSNNFQLARPLYDSDVEWAWSVIQEHDFSLGRRYTGSVLDTYDIDGEQVPERYRSRYVGAAARVTRSWGSELKTELTPGFTATWRDTEPEPRNADVSAEALAAYERERLPRSELALGPTLSLSSFRNEYFRLVDYQSFAVSEELREGHLFDVGLRYSEPGLGSDVRYLRVSTGLAWRFPIGDDAFVATGFDHAFRIDGGFSDVSISGSLRIVTPRALAGRLVMRVVGTELKLNDANTLLSVGGDSGLRGYPNGFLKGTRAMQANVEWRSAPLRIVNSSLGGVVFVDVGAAWEPSDPLVDYYPSVGVGLRLVVPSIGTVVRAGDVAFPLRPALGLRVGRPVVSLGLEHAF